MNEEICIITNGYPTLEEPVYAFIKPLANTMVDLGYKCTVIAPQSITNRLLNKKKRRPYFWIDRTEKGNEVKIYQPEYFSFSNFKIFGFNFSIICRDHAIKECFFKENLNPNAIYAHFWDCGMAASPISKEKNIPLYVASGESKIRVFDYYSQKYVRQNINQIKGLICVSTKNLNESNSLGLLSHNPKTIIKPNSINPTEFYKGSKEEARRKLGFALEDKIAIFVGAFSERKGVLRVVEAVEDNKKLKLILIGSGDQKPESKNIIFSGRVPHNEIVTYLNASDVFVLPTLAEGCCNAIVEAMACGLPVISSKLEFNDDILDSNNSIKIKPQDVNEISVALKKIISDENLRYKLSKGAEETAKDLTIKKRVESIIKFMGI